MAGNPKPKGLRRVERWLVGVAMAVVAFVLERIVVHSVKKKGPSQGPPPTIVTSKGAEVEVDLE